MLAFLIFMFRKMHLTRKESCNSINNVALTKLAMLCTISTQSSGMFTLFCFGVILLCRINFYCILNFRKISFSQKVQLISRCLGLRDPAIVQGMYIFKNPGIGKSWVIIDDAIICQTWIYIFNKIRNNPISPCSFEATHDLCSHRQEWTRSW